MKFTYKFNTRLSMYKFLNNLYDLITKYGYATVADANDLCGYDEDNDWKSVSIGWCSDPYICSKYDDGFYIVYLSDPSYIEQSLR